mmetsp:Transcript_13154/g.37475  ORF Transcript_13154/g.37475 Transcript_13154/m.37475 type:complete len:228 (+) Transcript_13154:963-1646(+)
MIGGQLIDDVHLDVDRLLAGGEADLLHLLDDDLLSGGQVVLVSGRDVVDNVGVGVGLGLLTAGGQGRLRLGQGQLQGGLLDPVVPGRRITDDAVDVADVDGTVVVVGVAGLAQAVGQAGFGIEGKSVRVGVRDAVVVPLGHSCGIGLELTPPEEIVIVRGGGRFVLVKVVLDVLIRGRVGGAGQGEEDKGDGEPHSCAGVSILSMRCFGRSRMRIFGVRWGSFVGGT